LSSLATSFSRAFLRLLGFAGSAGAWALRFEMPLRVAFAMSHLSVMRADNDPEGLMAASHVP